MDMTVNHAGNKKASLSINDFRVLSNVGTHITHRRNHLVIDGNIRRINFRGHYINQLASLDYLMGRHQASTGFYSFL